MFICLKKLFCKHDLEISRKPVQTQRWEEEFWNSSMVDRGRWVHDDRTSVDERCKKCGWTNHYLE